MVSNNCSQTLLEELFIIKVYLKPRVSSLQLGRMREGLLALGQQTFEQINRSCEPIAAARYARSNDPPDCSKNAVSAIRSGWWRFAD